MDLNTDFALEGRKRNGVVHCILLNLSLAFILEDLVLLI